MGVLVMVPLPRRHGEDIAFIPLQALALDDGAFILKRATKIPRIPWV
jgi:hypothetical protein